MATEAEKFDTVVRKILSVSREEIQERDKEWRRKRALAKKGGEKRVKNGR
jgi:hypothetical protein